MKNVLPTKILIWSSLLLAITTWNSDAGRAANADGKSDNQLYEVRTYLLGEDGDEESLDQYLQHALLPALKRQNIGPIGVFAPAENDTNQRPAVIVVVPFDNVQAMTSTRWNLQRDPQYLADADSYLEAGTKKPPYARITSELLVAMDCMPKLQIAADALKNPNRVYELRLYESANERLGDLKVDMFNNGEVPIFLDSGISPVFIGQAIIGPQTPNLTYLTVYPNDEARMKAWDAFRSHPDWQVLKEVAKYKGTVSKIDKHVLKAKPFSQM
ncbi:MAG: NIPSNAP family protein [Planctomycetales bacterium]|nr:NIPSNAP family protein [Planctomycetales bacterium]